MSIVIQAGNYKNITSTTQVTSKAGSLIGFYVNSTTAGTIVFRDGGSGGAQITGTITPAVGFHPLPATFGVSGLHATVGGTLDATIIYQPASGA